MILGESQFRIIAKTDSGAKDLCITVVDDPPNALFKKLCTPQENQDATQLFKWKSNRNQIIHAATGLCMTGSTTRFERVSSDNRELLSFSGKPDATGYVLLLRRRTIFSLITSWFKWRKIVFTLLLPISNINIGNIVWMTLKQKCDFIDWLRFCLLPPTLSKWPFHLFHICWRSTLPIIYLFILLGDFERMCWWCFATVVGLWSHTRCRRI